MHCNKRENKKASNCFGSFFYRNEQQENGLLEKAQAIRS